MKNTIITFSYLALFCVGLMENSRGAFYTDFINLFNVSTSSGSLLFSLSSLASFLATITSRFWLYRLSSVFATRVGLIFLFISTVIFYSVTYINQNFSIFMSLNLVYGLGIGILSISLNNLICENSRVDQRSRLLSGLHSMYGLASLVAPYILTSLYYLRTSWTIVFIILAIFAFLVLLFSTLINSSSNELNNEVGHFAPFKMYFLIGLTGALYVTSEVIVSSRLSFYLINSFKLSKVNANYLLSLFFIFLFLGRLLGSVIKTNIPKLALLKLSLILSISIILIGINFYPPLVALSALTMSYFFPYYMGFISEEIEKYQKDLIAKLMNFIGALLFISHWSFGVISDSYGLDVAMYLPVILLFIALYILHKPLTKLLK